jgi:hypothetical protein
MEIECRAPESHSIALWIEPWGDRIQIPPANRLRLTFEGEMIESLVVAWMERAISLGPPRYSQLRVVADSGDVLGEYDTKTLPRVPPGARPV